MDFTDLILPLLLFGILGTIGVTFGLAWIIFKAKYKDQVAAPSSPTPPPTDTTPQEIPLLTLRHAPDGTWEIAINGQRYPTLDAVPDDAVRREVVAGLKEMVAFARNYVKKTRTAQKPPPAAPTPPAPATPAAPPPGGKVRVLLKEEVLKRQTAAPVLMPTLDLAKEIGDIVAEMQTHIPPLRGRSIRLQNAPGGGVQFAIDGIVYPDVASIPDHDIQALIRAATQEWERR